MPGIALAAPQVGEAEIAAVVRSGHLVQGEEVAAFEDEFSEPVVRQDEQVT